jgi:hypothetical protein
MNNEIVHYGVKGMHWGVRRDRTEATTLSKPERKEAKNNIKKLSGKTFDSKYGGPGNPFTREISVDDYNNLSTKKYVVRKGQELKRVSTNKNEALDRPTYVSYTPSDKNLYRGIMPVVNSKLRIAGAKTYKSNYEYTYKTLETLRSPSEKERVDAFASLFDNPSITLKNGKKVTGKELLKKSYPKEVKTLNAQQLGLRFYNNFTETQGVTKYPINSAYFEELRRRGYNAVIDDNDRKHLSEAPLIILNPDGSIKRMSLKKLSADEINNAQRKLKVE